MRFNGRSTPPPAPPQPRVVAQLLTLPDFVSEEQSYPVTFTEPFLVPPVVTATPVLDDPTAAAVTVDDITEYGFVLHATRAASAPGFDVSWQAVEPTP